MHELGHAQLYDERSPLRGAIYAWGTNLPLIQELDPPFIRSFKEYKASVLAMKRFKTEEERVRASKFLEAGFGTYLMSDMLRLTFPFLPRFYRQALGTTVGLTLQGTNSIIRQLFSVAMTSGIWAGSVSGHILSRLPYPGKRERFGYVFEGKNGPEEGALDDRQVRYMSARATGG